MSSLFKWNRIASATNHSDRVVFSLTPTNQDNMISERYAIERFRSFGRKDLNEFAVKLEQLVENGRYSPEECRQFPQLHQLLKKTSPPNWVTLHGDFSQGVPCYNSLEISHSLCRKFNATPEQMMLRCVKYGDLPIK